jgi:hypothetical protein
MHPKHAAWLLPIALAACNRSPPPPPQAPAAAAAPAAPAVAAATELHDISERGPRYMIGISFPPELKRYPALAAEVQRDADAVRADFLKQSGANAAAGASGMFDLSLAYSMVAQSPRIVAVAAEGTSYVGGAHGAPLLARYVWLLPEKRRLTAAELIPDPAHWKPVADYAREQLLALQRQRLGDNGDAGDAADAAAAGDAASRREQLKNVTRMIEQGVEPKPENFANFEPVLAADGRIAALRFVFPPYQVGPYSDGVQSVEVPATVLLPLVAPSERALFAGG